MSGPTVRARGMNHFGLCTHDIEKTIDFYQGVLGFEPVAYYIRPLGGGHLRQVFFDLGNGQTLEFAEAHGVDDIAADFDAGINDGLGIGKIFGVGMVHFAFDVDSLDELDARKAALEAAGHRVLGPIDLDWLHSIYFEDPNGVQLEFAYSTRSAPGEAYLEPATSEQWEELRLKKLAG